MNFSQMPKKSYFAVTCVPVLTQSASWVANTWDNDARYTRTLHIQLTVWTLWTGFAGWWTIHGAVSTPHYWTGWTYLRTRGWASDVRTSWAGYWLRTIRRTRGRTLRLRTGRTLLWLRTRRRTRGRTLGLRARGTLLWLRTRLWLNNGTRLRLRTRRTGLGLRTRLRHDGTWLRCDWTRLLRCDGACWTLRLRTRISGWIGTEDRTRTGSRVYGTWNRTGLRIRPNDRGRRRAGGRRIWVRISDSGIYYWTRLLGIAIVGWARISGPWNRGGVRDR